MNAIVVDDEQMSRRTLSQLLEICCPQVNILGEADSADTAFELIQTKTPDVVFLDIEMPYGNGFELLSRFTEIHFEVIFVTAYDQYALKAIKFCALDYILKPINAEELQLAVKKLEQKQRTPYQKKSLEILIDNLKQSNSSGNRLVLPTQQGFEFLKVNEIVRCEADGRYTNIFLMSGSKLLVCKNLKEFESLLQEQGFLRIHHGHLINMNHIKKYNRQDGGNVLMEDGSTVAISRRKKELFLERLSQQ